jgi:hypothetical protein
MSAAHQQVDQASSRVPLDDEMIDEYARALITRLKWLTASETLDRLDIMIRARSEFVAKFGITADRVTA